MYLTDEHQPDRTTSETPFFCYTHLLMKINVGKTVANGPVPTLDALRTEGTDQQDAQLAPAYFDVSFCPLPCQRLEELACGVSQPTCLCCHHPEPRPLEPAATCMQFLVPAC